MTDKSPSLIRQEWLENAQVLIRKHFADKGYTVPANVRISFGIPKGSHGGKKAIGQCWSEFASRDKHHEVFVTPELEDPVQILVTLVHEDVHAVVGTKCGHKGEFKKCALAVGLLPPMTSTPAGPVLKEAIHEWMKKLGKYPAKALLIGNRKRQATRLLKCECEDCGYTVRTTRTWVENAGTPICPTDQVSMKCDAIDDEEG